MSKTRLRYAYKPAGKRRRWKWWEGDATEAFHKARLELGNLDVFSIQEIRDDYNYEVYDIDWMFVDRAGVTRTISTNAVITLGAALKDGKTLAEVLPPMIDLEAIRNG